MIEVKANNIYRVDYYSDNGKTFSGDFFVHEVTQQRIKGEIVKSDVLAKGRLVSFSRTEWFKENVSEKYPEYFL